MLFEGMEFGSYDKAEHKAHKAFELYEDGKMVQAVKELEGAIDINPANSSWHFDKALALDAMSRYDDAICEYETALQLCPDDLEISNSLAVDYTRTGQYDRAIDTFEKIQARDPNFEPCYCNRIITYAEMGRHDLAEQMFYLAQQIKSDCALCYYNIGNSLFVRGEYKKAVRCWLRTAELEPTHPQINYRIAQAYWADRDNVHAREHFLAELRVNPGDVDVILDFGLFLLEVGDVDSAKEKFNRVLELNPDFGAALFYLGEIAFNDGDHKRAVELFKLALQKGDSLQGPYFRLAQHALITGQLQKARTYLISELQIGPENADVLVSMGSMFLTMGDLDYAEHCLIRATDIDSANADAYYYLGLVSVNKEAFEDAVEFFDQVLSIRDDDIRALRDSAFVFGLMGKLADALEMINKARMLANDDYQLRAIERSIRLVQMIQHMRDFFSRFCLVSYLKRRLR